VVLLLLFGLVLFMFAAGTARSTAGDALTRWDEVAQSVAERVRGGLAPLATGERDADGAVDLVASLRRLQRRGRPLGTAMIALREEIKRGRIYMDQRRTLARLYLGRACLAVGLSLVIRIGLAGMWAVPRSGEDVIAVAMALMLMLAGQVWLTRSLPSYWLLGARPFALPWLESFVAGRAIKGAPWSDAARVLERRALTSGVSAMSEVRSLLGDWARGEDEMAKAKLTRLEEVLPLLELLTVGVPAALLLLIPMLEAVGS
jgi:hypothetical protein